MTLRGRLWRLARAELGSRARRLRDEVGELGRDGETREARLGAEAAEAEPRSDAAELHRFYANLELPFGATADEVKRAYRRLIGRYHPDRHHDDPERSATAHRLSQELRGAYEGLMRHLSRKR
jgi:DnaJ-domain-containing protein 1